VVSDGLFSGPGVPVLVARLPSESLVSDVVDVAQRDSVPPVVPQDCVTPEDYVVALEVFGALVAADGTGIVEIDKDGPAP